MTTAQWIRRFVREHPQYKFDSVVSQEINYDLVKAVDEVERGVRKADDLLGKDYKGEDFECFGDKWETDSKGNVKKVKVTA